MNLSEIFPTETSAPNSYDARLVASYILTGSDDDALENEIKESLGVDIAVVDNALRHYCHYTLADITEIYEQDLQKYNAGFISERGPDIAEFLVIQTVLGIKQQAAVHAQSQKLASGEKPDQAVPLTPSAFVPA